MTNLLLCILPYSEAYCWFSSNFTYMLIHSNCICFYSRLNDFVFWFLLTKWDIWLIMCFISVRVWGMLMWEPPPYFSCSCTKWSLRKVVGRKTWNCYNFSIKALTKPGDAVLDAYVSTCEYRPRCQSFMFDCSYSMFLCLFMHVKKRLPHCGLGGWFNHIWCHIVSIVWRNSPPYTTSHYIPCGRRQTC